MNFASRGASRSGSLAVDEESRHFSTKATLSLAGRQQSPGLERATASIAMASDFAAMLDEMMGPERNIDLDKVTGKRRRFDDEDVDRHFLVGCSPYQLFQGSKKNIGYLDEFARHAGIDPARNSRMVCDEACKAEYDALPQTEKDRLGEGHIRSSGLPH